MAEKMIGKIEALFERARHEATPEHERQLCLDKAEALMQKYRIDVAMLSMDDAKFSRSIESFEMDGIFGEFGWELRDMRSSVYLHCKCKVATKAGKTIAVGYSDDIAYGGMLWANIQMDFTSKMMPVWSKHRTFDQNVYLLKESGKSWMEIVYAENLAMGTKSTLNRNSGSRLRKAYASWAEKIGAPQKEQPRNPKAWREGFLQAYTSEVGARLRQMRWKAERENPPGKDGEIALQHDEDRVKAEFYKLFPQLDPNVIAEQVRKMEEAERLRRANMTQKERDMEDKKAERDRRRWQKEYKPASIDPSGWRAGTKAAREVDLSNSDKLSHNRRGLE